MGALTVRLLEGIARNELGAQPGSPLEFREIVNQAGEHLVGMYPWRWLEGRQARLRLRPAIDLTGATWTEAGLILTKVGAFAAYSPLSADTFELTSGTGATTGTYEVVSRPDADSVVLRTSIGAAANGQTDIVGTLRNDQIELPSDFDFQTISAWGMTRGLTKWLSLTSEQGMLDFRTFSPQHTIGFWALLRYVRGYAGGQAVPRLELSGTTDSADEALVIFYRGGWKEPDTDDEVLCPPSWMNGLFIEILKSIVMGTEESESGSLDARLTKLRMGVTFLDARARDMLAQPTMGPAENCWMDGYGHRLSRYDYPCETPTGP